MNKILYGAIPDDLISLERSKNNLIKQGSKKTKKQKKP